MTTPSMLRNAEHRELSRIALSGSVIDLGGEKNAKYLSYIKGDFKATAVNINWGAKPDIFHDLELPIPLESRSFDHAILMNVLEHVFEYRQLLRESARLVKKGGTITVIVPFLFPVHPSPEDYHRFTKSTLEKEFGNLGMRDITVRPLATGVFSCSFLMVDRLLPAPIRAFNYFVTRRLVSFMDTAWQAVANFMGKDYKRDHYPLGYIATGKV